MMQSKILPEDAMKSNEKPNDERNNSNNETNVCDDNDYKFEKKILIEVESIENVDINKIKDFSIRIEFKGEVLSETETIAVPESGECAVNAFAVINVQELSPSFMDDILSNPILFTLLDKTIVKFEKTTNDITTGSRRESQKASRGSLPVKSAPRSSIATPGNIIGHCNLDIGPLIIGRKLIKDLLIVEVEKSNSGPNVVTWPKLPRIYAKVSSGDEDLVPPDLNRLNNIISVTVESVYHAPANVEEGTPFDAIISLPLYGDKLDTLSFSGGTLTNAKDSECLKRWLSLSHIEGRSALSRHRINPDICDIINCDSEDIDLGKAMTENVKRIHWNKWRRSVMVKTGSNYFFGKLSKYRVWPIEVAQISRPTSEKNGKQEKKLKTAANSTTNFQTGERYVAYLKLGSLLYPGVTRVRVASGLYTYSSSDVIEKCGEDFVSPNVSSNTNKSKNGDKIKSVKEVEENKDLEGVAVYSEKGGRSFIVIEIELWKPYTPKREPEYFRNKFSAYFLPKGRMPKKQMNIICAKEKFRDIIEKLSYVINDCYNKFVMNCQNNIKAETMEDNFLNHLCRNGVFQQIKFSLEEKIVNLVGEKFGDITLQEDKLPEIFIYLVEKVREITNSNVFNSPSLKVIQVEADHLQLSAEEALEDGNFKLAKRYLLQKLSHNKLNPDYWLDYAHYCLTSEEHEKSIESIREALMLDIEHQMGLLMYGLVLAKVNELCLAELTFQVLLEKYPEFMEGWIVLHLFYSFIGNWEGSEFSLQMASKLNCEKKRACTNAESVEVILAAEDSSTSYGNGTPDNHSGNWNNSVEGKYGMATFVNGHSTTDPLSWTVLVNRSHSLYMSTVTLMLRLRAIEFAEAALARELLPEKPRSLEYLYYLAVSHYLRGQYSEAISHLQMAMEKYGEICLWTLLGHCYFKLQMYDRCIQCYEYVMESYNRPNDIHLVYIRMGLYYMKTNKYKCAKKAFLYACKYSPSARSWLGLGIACYNIGEFEEAEAALTEANYLDYVCPVVWAYLALVNIQLGRYDVFVLCYAEARKKNLKDQKLLKEIEALMEVHNIKLSV